MKLSKNNKESIIENNIQKSEQAIKDAEMLLKNKSLTASLNRIYYSVFYILSALAITYNFRTSKHTQLIGWFNKNFVKEHKVERKIGKFVQLAFDQRMESDYDIFSDFSFEETEQALANAKEVFKVIRNLVT